MNWYYEFKIWKWIFACVTTAEKICARKNVASGGRTAAAGANHFHNVAGSAAASAKSECRQAAKKCTERAAGVCVKSSPQARLAHLVAAMTFLFGCR